METNYSKYNIYSLLKKKANTIFLSIIIFLFLLVCLSFFFVKFDTYSSFFGIYICTNQECFIKTTIPLNVTKELKENYKIEVNKKNHDLNIKTFGEVEIIDSKEAIQYLEILIPKQEFYNNQTISFYLESEKKNLWQIIMKALKGGDE